MDILSTFAAQTPIIWAAAGYIYVIELGYELYGGKQRIPWADCLEQRKTILLLSMGVLNSLRHNRGGQCLVTACLCVHVCSTMPPAVSLSVQCCLVVFQAHASSLVL